MSKQAPDFSLEREGRSLSDWLRELVAAEASTRMAAGEAIQAIWFAVPSVHTDLGEIDWAAGADQRAAEHGERVKEAARAAVEAPGFPTVEFVRGLIAYRRALHEDWCRRVERMSAISEAPSKYEERLKQRIEAVQDEAEREEAMRRFMRWVCAKTGRDAERQKAISSEAESLKPPGIMASIIFEALDVALLADRPGLKGMLEDKQFFHEAARALGRIGPAAVEFSGWFLDRLDQGENDYFDGAEALGSIGRDDPGVVDGLLRRLRTGREAVRSGAAQALGHAGPPLAGRLEVAIDLLLGMTHEPSLVYAATEALASVGRDREEALGRVLELAAPKPPRWKVEEYAFDGRVDEVMYERGVAIDALRHFRTFADRVVPVLVEAFDSFEEYDPDWGYGGEHGRVCRVLKSFGFEAGPAVPRLVRYLEQWRERPRDDRQWPGDVLGLVAATGPAAAPALPVLERMRAELDGEDGALDPDEPLDRAILAAWGEV